MADRQGTVRQVFDNSGVSVGTASYDAFGVFLGGVPADRYGYTGREQDSLTALTHYRARERAGGAWLSEDPMGFGAGDGNLYRYAGNDTANRKDPSGYDSIVIKNDAVYFERIYRFKIWNNGGEYFIGKLVEIEGVRYVRHGKYLVALDAVRDAIERFYSAGKGGDWREDSNSITDWFKKNDVACEVTKPHEQRKVADRMFGPAAIAGTTASILVVAMVTDATEAAILQLLPGMGGGRAAKLFFEWAGGQGYKVIKNSSGIVLHIFDSAGNKLSASQYASLFAKFKSIVANTTLNRHHPIPKVLGGAAKQIFSIIPEAVHKEFHVLLDAKLQAAGFKLSSLGGHSAADWAKYFAANEGSNVKALQAIIEAASEIDLKHSTRLVDDIWRNIADCSLAIIR